MEAQQYQTEKVMAAKTNRWRKSGVAKSISSNGASQHLASWWRSYGWRNGSGEMAAERNQSGVSAAAAGVVASAIMAREESLFSVLCSNIGVASIVG
jgi:hypothetical protein